MAKRPTHRHASLRDRTARWGYIALLMGAGIALVAGAVEAFTWHPGAGAGSPVQECVRPPCFDFSMPRPADLPVVLPVLLYMAAVMLGVPSVLATTLRLRRRERGGVATPGLRGRRRGEAARTLLPFAGPVVVFLGVEIVPHVLNPCLVAEALPGQLPSFCIDGEHGIDVADRWHLLLHTLLGALPMVMLYRLALRRWRPELVGAPRP